MGLRAPGRPFLTPPPPPPPDSLMSGPSTLSPSGSGGEKSHRRSGSDAGRNTLLRAGPVFSRGTFACVADHVNAARCVRIEQVREAEPTGQTLISIVELLGKLGEARISPHFMRTFEAFVFDVADADDIGAIERFFPRACVGDSFACVVMERCISNLLFAALTYPLQRAWSSVSQVYPIGPQIIQETAFELMWATACVHRIFGIVVSDIKPENILLDTHGLRRSAYYLTLKGSM